MDGEEDIRGGEQAARFMPLLTPVVHAVQSSTHSWGRGCVAAGPGAEFGPRALLALTGNTRDFQRYLSASGEGGFYEEAALVIFRQ